MRKMGLGERLKKLREGKYSQEQLAELLHVHSNTISKWENGTQEPRLKRVQELAQLLDTTTNYLLEGTDSVNAESKGESPKFQPFSRTLQRGKLGSDDILVYENSNGDRFQAPATEIGIRYIEKMRKGTFALSGQGNS